MLDKRAIMRDMRTARMGLSRRIRLRMRSTAPASVASVDPLSDAAPSPSTDTFKYVTGHYKLLKSTEDYDAAGALQKERAVVYFHTMLSSELESAYSMYIGGTKKEWTRISRVMYDDARTSLKIIVESAQ